ncbi:VapE domain-containing protein [Runella sp.]|uniref:VapE domain-containing protein n=1 Tax=Runella sp. TaxID=1960881 RepID=UPI003D0C9953
MPIKSVKTSEATKEAVKEPEKTKEFKARTDRQRLMYELKQRYHFHLNEIKGRPEYCLKGEDDPFNITGYKPVDEYAVNSIINELDAETDLRKVSADVIFSILNSDFVKMYHPVKAYFNSFERSDFWEKTEGTTHIEKLANTLKTPNPKTFALALQRWMSSSIAQVFEGDSVLGKNQTAIVLCSDAHGVGKTSWISMLCPTCFKVDYYFQGKIRDLDSNEVPILLAEKFILNIDDQFHNLVRKDNNTMKTYISHGKITTRRTYGRYNVELPRLGNFIGSINGNAFLDDEANRRYYPFVALSVDWPTLNLIDVDFAWMEAYKIYKLYKQTRHEQYRYWWTPEDIEKHFGDLSDFKQNSQEFELFLQYFEPCKFESDNGLYMTNSSILTELKYLSKASNLSDKKLGSALKRLNCFQTRKKISGVSTQVYKVQKRDIEDFENRINGVGKYAPKQGDIFN